MNISDVSPVREVARLFEWCEREKLDIIVLCSIIEDGKLFAESFTVGMIGVFQGDVETFCKAFDEDYEWPPGNYARNTMCIVRWIQGDETMESYYESEHEYILSEEPLEELEA